ncbi:bifunctional precorrin-2 dehydrogenase/sirohydrochlorin ferrochelatase [Planctomycetota bacterium]
MPFSTSLKKYYDFSCSRFGLKFPFCTDIMVDVMSGYPIFLELASRRAVVVGAGAVALRKAQSLLAAGARLVVVAEHIEDSLMKLCMDSDAELIKSKYSKDYLAGAALVIAATNNQQLNQRIYKHCQELEILCNVVDQPELCDFFVPAVVRRGDLQIAVSTEGSCPAYAGHIKKKLEKLFTDQHGQFLTELQKLRNLIIKDIFDPTDRKTLLGQLVNDKSFEYFVENGTDNWKKYADEIISVKRKNSAPKK